MSALSLTETINKLKEYRKTDKIDKQTLAYAEYWLCYAKEHGVTGDCSSNKMILITTLQELPEYCYECPCHDGDNGECQADKERRRSSEYRPYWCPLKETELMNDLTR